MDLFDERLALSAAVFHTVRENVAITGRTGVLTTDPVSLQGYGEQIAEGSTQPHRAITPAWSIYAGAVYMETERSHSADLDLYRCRAILGDFGVGSNPAACTAANTVSGDELAFSPTSPPISGPPTRCRSDSPLAGRALRGRQPCRPPDDAERIIPNNESNKLPDYWVADAMIEYAVTPQATLRLNVDNITDEYYAVSTNWSAQRALIGPSRSFLLSLALRM